MKNPLKSIWKWWCRERKRIRSVKTPLGTVDFTQDESPIRLPTPDETRKIVQERQLWEEERRERLVTYSRRRVSPFTFVELFICIVVMAIVVALVLKFL